MRLILSTAEGYCNHLDFFSVMLTPGNWTMMCHSYRQLTFACHNCSGNTCCAPEALMSKTVVT